MAQSGSTHAGALYLELAIRTLDRRVERGAGRMQIVKVAEVPPKSEGHGAKELSQGWEGLADRPNVKR